MSTRLALLCSLLFGAALVQEAARPARTLELEYLANEGFLLRGQERRVLVDAFLTEPYGEYAAVPAELFARLCKGEGDYGPVALAVTSHVHSDHFQAGAARAYLDARSETRFLAAPQVLEKLRAELAPEFPAARLLARWPEGDARLVEGELGVELLRLPHAGGARTAAVENLGLVLEVDGVRVLHVGDAERDDAALTRLDPAELALDVALVPYWWLDGAEGLARVRARTGAREIVAMHVPPGEVAAVKARLARLDARLILFERPGERRTLRFD